MGTRSLIGRKNEDGTLDTIYCHWDGYPEHNGRVLLENYQAGNIDALIALGDLSVLGETIGKKHAFDWQAKFYERMQKAGKEANYRDDPRSRMCTAYGRDRNEKNTAAVHYATVEQFEVDLPKVAQEFLYVFDTTEKKWYWMDTVNAQNLDGIAELTPSAWEAKTKGAA